MALSSTGEIPPFSGWPSGDRRHVLATPLRLDAVRVRLRSPCTTTLDGHLAVRNDDDGLGPYRLTRIWDPAIEHVVLMDHDRAPVKGTVAVVDSAVDPSLALRRLVDLLSLTADELTWSAVPLVAAAERPRAAE